MSGIKLVVNILLLLQIITLLHGAARDNKGTNQIYGISNSGPNYVRDTHIHLPAAMTSRLSRSIRRMKRLMRQKRLPSALVASSPLNANERADMVDQHNFYRRKALATDMQYIRWDNTLAESAQAHANRCTFSHSTDRHNIGENIWAAHYPDYSKAAFLWWNESNDPNCDCGISYKHCCGHYTQMVWAASNRIGCGFAECAFTDTIAYRYVLVCHYSPQGNIVKYKPSGNEALPAFRYQTDTKKACSECPKESGQCENGLCY